MPLCIRPSPLRKKREEGGGGSRDHILTAVGSRAKEEKKGKFFYSPKYSCPFVAR